MLSNGKLSYVGLMKLLLYLTDSVVGLKQLKYGYELDCKSQFDTNHGKHTAAHFPEDQSAVLCSSLWICSYTKEISHPL